MDWLVRDGAAVASGAVGGLNSPPAVAWVDVIGGFMNKACSESAHFKVKTVEHSGRSSSIADGDLYPNNLSLFKGCEHGLDVVVLDSKKGDGGLVSVHVHDGSLRSDSAVLTDDSYGIVTVLDSRTAPERSVTWQRLEDLSPR